MKKIDVGPIIQSVVEDYNSINNLKKNITINFKNDGNDNYFIKGIENRIEQIIANLLDNSISFSEEGNNILVHVSINTKKEVTIKISDEGRGFKENDTNKIFKRFYSNRPDKFGEHSGLGLNIVKNLVDIHEGKIFASNREKNNGAEIKINFPST
jgi:two-component system sensor histidine kinase ChvG